MQSAKEAVNYNLGSNGRHIQQVEAFLVILLSKNWTVLILLYGVRKKCHEKVSIFHTALPIDQFWKLKKQPKIDIRIVKIVLVEVITAAGVLCSSLLCLLFSAFSAQSYLSFFGKIFFQQVQQCCVYISHSLWLNTFVPHDRLVFWAQLFLSYFFLYVFSLCVCVKIFSALFHCGLSIVCSFFGRK